MIDYAKSIIDDLVDAAGAPASFIRTFARAIDLASIEGTARPTVFAIDVAGLTYAIHDGHEIRLLRETGGRPTELSKIEIDAILGELDRILKIDGAGKAKDLIDPADGTRVGTIALNRSRVALRDLRLPLSADIEVEETTHLLGRDPNRMSLRRYIDRKDRFILLFDALSLAYIDGTLFRDDGFVDGGAALLRHLRPNAILDTVTDEKGTFTSGQVAFDGDSTFGAIVQSVAEGDEVLVCDDLGDEWADFNWAEQFEQSAAYYILSCKAWHLVAGRRPVPRIGKPSRQESTAYEFASRIDGCEDSAMAAEIREWERRSHGDLTHRSWRSQ